MNYVLTILFVLDEELFLIKYKKIPQRMATLDDSGRTCTAGKLTSL